MSRDTDRPAAVIPLAEARQRRQAARGDVLIPVRQAFLEDFADLLDGYVEQILEVGEGDLDLMVEEMMAALSTALALAAEDHFDDEEDQLDFIDGVAEIAAELIDDESGQGELFDDEEDSGPR